MLMSVFHNWLLEIACENYFVYIKRLSANDTGATGGHQVGLYIPSGIVEKLFPSINHTRELNPSGKRAARTVLTGMCYSVGSATRQGSSSLTRFIGQSAMTSRT